MVDVILSVSLLDRIGRYFLQTDLTTYDLATLLVGALRHGRAC